MVKRNHKKSPPLGIKLHAYLYWFLGLAVFLLGFVFLYNKHQDLPCANSVSCISDLSGKFDPSQKEGVFMGQKVSVPSNLAQNINNSKVVLGDTSSSNKHIYIDLSAQKLYAKEGDRTVYEFLISSGKWGRTPTGNFTTWIKLQATRMKGGSTALGTFYDLPNVPYTMYFYGDGIPKSRGYGIHGAYWHNNFGHPMSHGCINMRIEEAHLLFDWANPPTQGYTTYADDNSPGTPITIYGTTPAQ